MVITIIAVEFCVPVGGLPHLEPTLAKAIAKGSSSSTGSIKGVNIEF
jgi:hypothetical protein